MKTSNTRHLAVYVLALATTFGVSGASLAQSNAIDALQRSTEQTNSAAAARSSDHLLAERLSATLDAHNNAWRADYGANDSVNPGPAPQDLQRARQLSKTLDARNGHNTTSATQENGDAAGGASYSAYPLAEDLSAKLETYYHSNGSHM